MRDRLALWVRTGLITALIDGLFASVLNVAAYDTPVTRLWQGVASVLVGPQAIDGGAGMVALGLLLHVLVAFTWSAIFLFIVYRWSWVRRLATTPAGVFMVAAIYGPIIWMVMSIVVIPIVAQRLPRIGARWGVQLVGHIPFVALPIVASVVMGRRRASSSVSPAPAS